MAPSSRAGNKRRAVATAKVLIGLILVCGLAGGLYAALSPRGHGPANHMDATADRASVKRVAFEVATIANGELEAKNKEEYRNPLDQQSTITQIVPEGTRVKSGDLLVQLNVEEIQLKVDEEELKVESARAEQIAAEKAVQIQENENASKLRQSDLKLALAQLALNQWRDGDVQKKRNDLQLDTDRSVLELDRLAQLYTRSQGLNQEGFLSKDQLDKDEVLYIEAIAKYKTSLLALAVYEEFEFRKDEKKYLSDVEEAKAEIERVNLNNVSELASKTAELENRRKQLKGAENRLAKLVRQRDEATITARKDGLVVYSTTLERGMRWGGGGDGPLQIGTQVYPNQLLVVLPDTSEMVAALRVHESLSSKLHPGQSVAVKVDAAGGVTFMGTVDSVGVMAESGGWRDPNLREYTVRVALDTKAENLKPAMRCEGRIILDAVPETLTVPVQAVFNEGPVMFVYVPQGQKYTRKPIRMGRRSETLAEISKGVDEGEVVLIREPTSGEIISEPWRPEQLTLAGYKLGEDGKVLAEGGGSRGPMGGGKGGGSGTAGRGSPDAMAKRSGAETSAAKPEGGAGQTIVAETSAPAKDEKSEPAKAEPAKAAPAGTAPAKQSAKPADAETTKD